MLTYQMEFAHVIILALKNKLDSNETYMSIPLTSRMNNAYVMLHSL